MKLKNLLFIILIVSAGLLQSQEIEKTVATNDSLSEAMTQQDSIQSDYKIKRLSIGLKVGIPNVASVGAQYTLPILNNHLAPYFEYSAYAYDDDKREGDLKFSEFGVSYYFNEKGKGLYLGVGVSSLKVMANYNDISLDFGKTGSGSTEIALNTTNLKLGFKTGGSIYFRVEVGYGMGDLPQTFNFTATDNSNPLYTETVTKDIPEIPGISESGMIIGNIGFGVSF